MLDCSDEGGCWKSRIKPLYLEKNDEKDESLCIYPVELSGQWIGRCMDMISADEVCLLLKKYMDNLDYKEEKPEI